MTTEHVRENVPKMLSQISDIVKQIYAAGGR
ncbi:hypothetical protein NC653_024619 [Populus alba x Populus x berolinensis]|uniref:Uncharacterized protein n=1 Tax=Populus alba x Populus x berolinensis TaxID=444605 RepID=A0AAD6MA14_9ROSI|nr:hypothetical protein NC653_024619 [Populus alba x Populus x berolinensis]